MKTKPMISVLIPVYNGEKYIGEAIESVLNQTYQNYELIIVDDKSQDSSCDLIKSYCDSRIHFEINKKNLGLTGNWNRCIQLATGKFITMLHQDDVMLNTNLEKKIKILSNSKYRWIASNCFQINQNNEVVLNHWYRHDIAMKIAEKKLKKKFDKMFFKTNYLCFTTIMWEAELLKDIGEFKDKGGYCTDVHMWLRILNKEDFYYIPEQLIKYRWAQNLSLRYSAEDWYFDDCLARKEIVEELNLNWRYKYFLILYRGAGFLKKYIICKLKKNISCAEKMKKGFKMIIGNWNENFRDIY